MFAIHPSTGHCECMAGTGYAEAPIDGPALSATFAGPLGVVVIDNECSAYVSNLDADSIRRLTLPPSYFLTRTQLSLHLPNRYVSSSDSPLRSDML